MEFNLNYEQQMWKDAIHSFVSKELKPFAAEIDASGEFNWEAVRKMGALGLLGMTVPEEYGGAGVDSISMAIAIEELGWSCGGTALSIAAHNGLGCAPIVAFGSEEQKQKFLPPVVSGKGKLSALALTEPGAGSDLQAITTKADRSDDRWIINGSKMWCTNATIADYIITMVVTNPSGGSRSLSMIIVPTDTPGLHIGSTEKKMGVKGSPTSEVTYEDVEVPDWFLLGEEGKGLQQALSTLDGGRISIGALSVGLAQAAYEEAVRYSKERTTFGKLLAQHQAIQYMLADAQTEIEASRLMVHKSAWLKDIGKPYAIQAAMAKLFASETAERVSRDAIQILGGYGYSSEYPVERIYRDARLMTIGEGTSEILRLVIGRHSTR